MEEIFAPMPYVILAALLIVGAVYLSIARTRRRASARLMAGYDPSDVILAAEDVNLVEHTTPGARATGNGTLILTREEMAFRNWDGQSMRIPLRAVQRLEGAQLTMRGKNMRPLLRVYFTEDTGAEERAAWLLQGAQEWAREIERARRP